MTRDKKYEFTGETKKVKHPVTGEMTTVRQIQLLRPLRHMGVFTQGGWIEDERNLNQHGDAWVGVEAVALDRAYVTDSASVRGRAIIAEQAMISRDARVINGIVTGDASVGGCAEVHGRAMIGGNATITDLATIGGHTVVSGSAWVGGTARVYDDAVVTGTGHVMAGEIRNDAHVESAHHVLAISGLTRGETVMVYRRKDGGAIMAAGCQNVSPWLSDEKIKALAKLHEWDLEEGWKQALTLARVVTRRWRREHREALALKQAMAESATICTCDPS